MLKKTGWVFILLVFLASFLHSKILHVPHDYLTIKTAVGASQAGDIVQVDDGIYFEKNIIIDKKIRIESRHLFGAVIYGSVAYRDAIFVVRAEADISGFVLQNSYWGILQRYSPDVCWTADDLVIMNMLGAGISINATSGNIGSAVLENIYIDHCWVGFETNDAHDLRISGSLISSCRAGVVGSNHISFLIEKSAIMNCEQEIRETLALLSGRATNKISIGGDVIFPDHESTANQRDGLRARLSTLWKRGSPGGEDLASPAQREFVLDQAVGEFHFRHGEFAQARALWASALDRVKTAGFLDMTWRMKLSLARAAARLGDSSAALEHLKDAVGEIVSLSEGLPFKYFQESFFEDKSEVFDDILALLYEMHTRQPDRGYDREAFRYSEIAKSLGSWSDRLDFRKAVPGEAFETALEIQGSAALRGVARNQRMLAEIEMTDDERRGVLEKLEVCEDEYKAYLIQRKRLLDKNRSPSHLLLLRPEEIQKRILDRETALVEYFLGSSQAYAFFLAQDSLKMVRLSKADRLDSLIPNYLAFLNVEQEREFRGAKGGRLLCDALLGPLNLGAFPEIKRLIVVPDGILHYLPFDALVLPPGRFLLDRYEVTYAPSAVFLAYLSHGPRPESPPMDLLALANPGPKSPPAYSMTGAAALPKLRFVGKELDVIAKRFQGLKTRIVPPESSSEEFLRSLDLSRYRIVHLAAHGLFDEKRWWRSGLLLDPGKGPEEDGLLQPMDIVTLHFNADLVVLSSCVSGSAPIHSGKGIVGLHQSFFLAGAKAVLATLWAINDRSTARLMDVFYSDLRKGKSASESLRSAKLDMIRSGYSHPRYWAAFVLNGAGLNPIFPGQINR